MTQIGIICIVSASHNITLETHSIYGGVIYLELWTRFTIEFEIFFKSSVLMNSVPEPLEPLKPLVARFGVFSSLSPDFSILHQVGEGTYGKVYKASTNSRLVALKKLFLKEDDKVSQTNKRAKRKTRMASQ
jgi:serine/threonine protein kinase